MSLSQPVLAVSALRKMLYCQGALEGLAVDRAVDLPGLVAAKIRDAERARPDLLGEKLAQGRARNRVFD